MSKLLLKCWQDDEGAIIATEYLFVATILIIGIVVGLTNLRSALNAELTELGNAILALSEGYAFSGQSGCCANTDGSQAIDTPATLTNPTCVPASIPSVIDVIPCQ